VEKVNPDTKHGFPWVLRETLWEGPFRSERGIPETESDNLALWEEAERFGADMPYELEPGHVAKDSETLEALVVWEDSREAVWVVGKARPNTPAFADRAVPVQACYRHYKGGEYELLHYAVRALPREEVVVYRHVGTSEIWVCPKAMFFGTLPDGGLRFTRKESL
jgi:hypothetical protein